MDPIQIVIDTNVVVSATRSRKGSSYELIARIGDPRWQMNISSALLLEYEARLGIELLRQGRAVEEADVFLDLVAGIGNRRTIPHAVRRLVRDKKDDFVLELAIASDAQFVVTYNLRDFVGSEVYGVRAVTPREFLVFLEVT